jgi:hypothetical protein
VLQVTLRNDGPVSISGRAVARTPAGWPANAPSPLVTLAPGATATAAVPVTIPYDAAGSQSVAVDFVDRGVTLASGGADVTAPAITAPPTEATSDHVDFGDLPSETAHGVRGSPTSGTSSEAGFTRRYANNTTPGAWYSAEVAVPAGQAFLLRMRETWNSQGTKDYDVYVDDVLVHHVRMVRTASGQGVSTHQLLVDEPVALLNDGSVTVRFVYPLTNAPQQFYDPSIADLWALGAPDELAPTVSAATGDEPPLGDGGWYVGAAEVAIDAADDTDAAPLVEYRTGAGWQPYGAPFTVAAEGRTTVSYRATDAAGNVSPIETLPIWVDTVAPTAEIAPPPPTSSGWYAEEPAVAVNASDDGSGVAATEYRLGTSGPWTTYSGPVRLSEQQPLIQTRTRDRAGHRSEVVERALRIDTTVPTVQAEVSDRRQLTVEGADANLERVEYALGDGSWTRYEAPVQLGWGATDVRYRALDAAGNSSAVGEKRLGSGEISGTLSTPARTPWRTAAIPVTLTFDQPVSGLAAEKIAVSGGTAGPVSGSGTTYTFEVTAKAEGTVTVAVPAGAATAATGAPTAAVPALTIGVDYPDPTTRDPQPAPRRPAARAPAATLSTARTLRLSQLLREGVVARVRMPGRGRVALTLTQPGRRRLGTVTRTIRGAGVQRIRLVIARGAKRSLTRAARGKTVVLRLTAKVTIDGRTRTLTTRIRVRG